MGLVLEWFGADRVIFGSDWPVCSAVANCGQVMGLAEKAVVGLSSAERESGIIVLSERTTCLWTGSGSEGRMSISELHVADRRYPLADGVGFGGVGGFLLPGRGRLARGTGPCLTGTVCCAEPTFTTAA